MTNIDNNNPAIADISTLVKLRFGARDLKFFPRLMAKNLVLGGHQSRFRGRGMDFEEVRQYQPGDDIRTIDWRVTARTMTTHTKLFSEERERPVLVVTDLRPTMFFGSKELKSVTACQVAAALAWAGLNANDRVGGLIFGAEHQYDIRARRSHHSVLQLIHKLRDFSEQLIHANANRYTMAEILEDTRRVAMPGSTLFLISDFHDLDKNCEQHLFELARHCDINICHIHDGLEAQLPPPANYQVSNGHQRFNLNTQGTDLRRQFEKQFRDRQAHLKTLCSKLRMGSLSFETAVPIMPVLQQAYGRKTQGRRR
tara:strand:+ start:2686 stop:3621 length:936 start_codon:yes stop_codon:yes gene_type:complete